MPTGQAFSDKKLILPNNNEVNFCGISR